MTLKVILLTAVIAAAGIFEIPGMVKKGQTREIIVFIAIALLAFAMGLCYILSPHEKSLIYYTLKLLGLEL